MQDALPFLLGLPEGERPLQVELCPTLCTVACRPIAMHCYVNLLQILKVGRLQPCWFTAALRQGLRVGVVDLSSSGIHPSDAQAEALKQGISHLEQVLLFCRSIVPWQLCCLYPNFACFPIAQAVGQCCDLGCLFARLVQQWSRCNCQIFRRAWDPCTILLLQNSWAGATALRAS